METWKLIEGFGGAYQVSDKGNVRRFYEKSGFVGYEVGSVPKEMKPTDNGNGYLIVGLRNGKTRTNKYVHRLVAEAFLGQIPAGYVINHIDHNKKNNAVENLEIVTPSKNINHSSHLMKHPKNRSEFSYIAIRKNGFYEVTVNKKYLGRFTSIERAKAARDEYIEKINYY